MAKFKPLEKELASLKESALGICGSFIGLAGYICWVYELAPAHWAVLALIFGIIAFCVAKIMGRKRKTKQKTDYATYLSTLRTEILAAVLDSPEFDSRTKKAVVEYLNVYRPGWSLPVSG